MIRTASSNEIWADIPGFEGSYQVSNRGRVRSCDRYIKASRGMQKKHGQIIRPMLRPNGYLTIGLYMNGKRTERYVHRIVALLFVDNPNMYDEVNHKDENKTNNCSENLEWCTHGYNINYGTAKEKISKTRLEKGYGAIPVAQMLDGKIIATYKSASDAERATGICASAIRKVCLGRSKFKSAGGYSWKNI